MRLRQLVWAYTAGMHNFLPRPNMSCQLRDVLNATRLKRPCWATLIAESSYLNHCMFIAIPWTDCHPTPGDLLQRSDNASSAADDASSSTSRNHRHRWLCALIFKQPVAIFPAMVGNSWPWTRWELETRCADDRPGEVAKVYASRCLTLGRKAVRTHRRRMDGIRACGCLRDQTGWGPRRCASSR